MNNDVGTKKLNIKNILPEKLVDLGYVLVTPLWDNECWNFVTLPYDSIFMLFHQGW